MSDSNDYGLSSEEISSILQSMGDQSQADDLDSQIAAARKLRHQSVPDTVNGAPNLSGILGSVIDAYKSKKDEKHLQMERDIINNRQAWNNESFWRALQARQARQAAPAAAPVPGGAPDPYNPAADPTNIFAPR
jgi:hypothetical protein